MVNIIYTSTISSKGSLFLKYLLFISYIFNFWSFNLHIAYFFPHVFSLWFVSCLKGRVGARGRKGGIAPPPEFSIDWKDLYSFLLAWTSERLKVLANFNLFNVACANMPNIIYVVLSNLTELRSWRISVPRFFYSPLRCILPPPERGVKCI